MASPHPLPLSVAKLTGADRKNPQRYRDRKASVTCVEVLGAPPDRLTLAAQGIWKEVQEIMVDGVITRMDLMAMEAFCELMAEFREDPRAFNGAKYGRLITFFSLFGMTPVDRQKIRAEKPEAAPHNAFEMFAA